MRKLFLGFITLLLLSACGGNSDQNPQSNASDPTENQQQNSSNKGTSKTEQYPLGTWIDFKTGEVMVFTENEVYWAKKPGVKMTALEIKAKEAGKIGVFFKNKPNTIYDMLYDPAQTVNTMECKQGAKKLNDYKKQSDNTNPEKVMEAIEASFPKAEDFKTGNPEWDALPTVADVKHLMFWFHKPKQFWRKGKTIDQGDFFKVQKRAAAKMKLSENVIVVLHTDIQWGDMIPPCYNAYLSTFQKSKPTEMIGVFDVQSGFQGEVCKDSDMNHLKDLKLADNGDLVATVQRIDKFDEFDQNGNAMAKDDIANGLEARFEIRKEVDYEIMQEIRFDHQTGNRSKKELSKKEIK